MFRRFVNSDNNHKKERKRRLYLFIHSQFTQFIMDLTPYPKNATDQEVNEWFAVNVASGALSEGRHAINPKYPKKTKREEQKEWEAKIRHKSYGVIQIY